MPAERPSRKTPPAKAISPTQPPPQSPKQPPTRSAKREMGGMGPMGGMGATESMAADQPRDDEAGLPADKIKRVEVLFDLVRKCNGPRECWLLLGAGCSFPEVPLAEGFVDIIKNEYPEHFDEAAEPKGYAQCMHELLPEDRRQIIRDSIDKARILEGYIAIASLIKAGFIHKVLTVNFDPLLIKACALVGTVPAVYDLAASLYAAAPSAGIRPTLATPAIVHLHGQNEGIVLINGPEEVEKMAKRLGWLFEGADKHLWIVAGYSGEQDPVFERLAQTAQFGAGLFWMRHDGLLPCPAVVKMIKDRPGAAVVFNQPCNDLFALIARKMNCYPPAVLSKPLEHIEDQLKTRLSDSCDGIIAKTIGYIERAREAIKADAATTDLRVQSLAQAGDFDGAFELFWKLENPSKEGELHALVAGAATTGDQLLKLFAAAKEYEIESATVGAVAKRGLEVLRSDPDGVLKLLASLPSCDTLAGLKELRLNDTQVTDAGLVHLKGLTGLQYLSLEGTHVTDVGLVHLKGLTGLLILDLDHTQVTNTGLTHLQRIVGLQNLRLNHTRVGNAGMVYLKDLTGLQSLWLSDTQVTDAGLVHLKGLTRLHRLDLDNTGVADAGLVHLKGLTGLQTLWLNGTQVTDTGLMHLKGMTSLQSLRLNRTGVTDTGLAHLKGLTGLQYLWLNGTQVTDAGVAELKEALPDCNISGP